MKLLKNICILLEYVLLLILSPVSIVLCIYEYVLHKKYIGIMKNVINSSPDFFEYIQKLGFRSDWLNRLYSVQLIPKEFSDFTDDELYDITMRGLMPMYKLIERNILIDVISVVTRKIAEDMYVITLTPKNFPKLKKYFILSLISVLIDIVSICTLCVLL